MLLLKEERILKEGRKELKQRLTPKSSIESQPGIRMKGRPRAKTVFMTRKKMPKRKSIIDEPARGTALATRSAAAAARGLAGRRIICREETRRLAAGAERAAHGRQRAPAPRRRAPSTSRSREGPAADAAFSAAAGASRPRGRGDRRDRVPAQQDLVGARRACATVASALMNWTSTCCCWWSPRAGDHDDGL